MARHLTRDQMEKLLTGTCEGHPEATLLLEHLKEACATCRALAEEIEQEKAQPRSLDQVMEEAASVARRHLSLMTRLKGVAASELKELLKLEPEKRRLRIGRSNTRFKNPILVELLIEESRRRLREDPFAAYELGECACEVALRVPHNDVGRGLAMTCLARANAHRGNSLRVIGELRRAESLLTFALEMFLAEGNGDPLVEAELMTLWASLRRDQRRFGDARENLSHARQLYEACDEGSMVGSVLIQEAVLLFEEGQPESAISAVQQAFSWLDPERDARLYLIARHNLVDYLQEAGRHAEVRQELERLEPLYQAEGDPLLLLRRTWISGRIARGLGQWREAEEIFHQVRSEFVSRGMGLDAAAVGLDLALLFVDQGRATEVKRLAEETVPIFLAQDVQREAAAALLLFQEAARREVVTRVMLAELITYLRRVRPRRAEQGE